MRKAIGLVITVLLVFILSGCGSDKSIEIDPPVGYVSCEYNEGWIQNNFIVKRVQCVDDLGGVFNMSHISYLSRFETDEIYYTQEEVDIILNEQAKMIIEMLYDNYVEYDDYNNLLYSNCIIVDGIKHCDIIFDLNEYDRLLERIEELENGDE